MIEKNWIEKINEIRSECAGVGLPVDVGTDTTPHGIDCKIELGDMTIEQTGDIFDINFTIGIMLSVPESKWAVLVERMMMLTEKLTSGQRFIFTGWTREEDESNLIYTSTIDLKGLANNVLLDK